MKQWGWHELSRLACGIAVAIIGTGPVGADAEAERSLISLHESIPADPARSLSESLDRSTHSRSIAVNSREDASQKSKKKKKEEQESGSGNLWEKLASDNLPVLYKSKKGFVEKWSLVGRFDLQFGYLESDQGGIDHAFNVASLRS